MKRKIDEEHDWLMEWHAYTRFLNQLKKSGKWPRFRVVKQVEENLNSNQGRIYEDQD